MSIILKIKVIMIVIIMILKIIIVTDNIKSNNNSSSRSSRPEALCKKSVLKFSKIHRKTPVPESLF